MFDDAWLCVEILNSSLARYGIDAITVEQYQAEFGFPVKDYYEKLGFDFSEISFDEVAKEYIEEYNEKRFECKLGTDALDVLQSCLDAGLDQSILSAYQQDMLDEIVEFFGIRNFFKKLFGLNDYYANCKIAHGKLLIRQLDVAPERVLMVGDTIHDYEVAKQIGCDCVLIPSGHQSRRRLLACGAIVTGSLKEVTELWKKNNSEV